MPSWPFSYTIYWIEQEFEVCAVCMGGPDSIGIRSMPNEVDEISAEVITRKYWLENVTVYGCIKWSHWYNPISGRAGNFMGGGFRNGNPMGGLMVTPTTTSGNAGGPPSKDFVETISGFMWV